jgi:hypothetical protein
MTEAIVETRSVGHGGTLRGRRQTGAFRIVTSRVASAVPG